MVTTRLRLGNEHEHVDQIQQWLVVTPSADFCWFFFVANSDVHMSYLAADILISLVP